MKVPHARPRNTPKAPAPGGPRPRERDVHSPDCVSSTYPPLAHSLPRFLPVLAKTRLGWGFLRHISASLRKW